MEKKVYAVITGDLVDSTTIKGDYKGILEKIANDIIKYQADDFIFIIYRGDSFQGLVIDPAKALLLGILIRAGLRRNTRGKGLEEIWDARIAIGIGTVENLKLKPKPQLGALDGEAFVRSGRTLDSMKGKGALLNICTGDQQLDDEFAAICPLADTLISRWSTAQAEAIYLYLLENITQNEIGKHFGISQRAISKRLETSSIEDMKPFFERYENVIAWKYNN